MLRLPLETELAAATAAAAKAGLGLVMPNVLHLGNHTTVKLNPWPIVARIASGTSFDFSHGSLAREPTIASLLAAREAPTVRPTTEVAPGPYLENDCAITLWEFVRGRAVCSQSDELMAARSLKLVHSALAEVDADLPAFIAKVESCDTILANPAEAPKLARGDRLFLEKLYATLREKLNEAGGAWQPLHGDTHLGNVLISGSGAVWMDLEAACVGPLEWDVINLPAATWSEFGRVNEALMHLLLDVRSLCVAVWCWAEFDRSAASAEAAIYHLAQLKSRFS
jgi:aminoglycoside phosphotransferase (APT) family kinase protein